MKTFENFSLLQHNTFGLAARCRHFVEYDSLDDLRQVLVSLRKMPELSFLHIGCGSNLLFTKDYEGTILHSAILGKQVIKETSDTLFLKVGAGEKWDDLVAWCVSQGYYGLENLSYIPGEVGAAAVQNIGAYGKEVGDFIVSVETIEVDTGKIRIFEHDECCYAYRYSAFKGEFRGKYVVTSVVFRLTLKFVADLTYGALKREVETREWNIEKITAEMLRNLVVQVRKSKLPEPEDLGSAGSFFMNPIIEKSLADDLLKQYPHMPHYEVDRGVKVPAGWLIEQCGWKGKHLGAAGVYEKQALVLVNLGGASGADICRLSETIQHDVKAKFGISIYPEVNFI